MSLLGQIKRLEAERDTLRDQNRKLVEALAGTLGLIDSLVAADDANGWIKSQESYSVAKAVLQEVRK